MFPCFFEQEEKKLRSYHFPSKFFCCHGERRKTKW